MPGSTRTPPSWDPLGAAPFAWDLPEPAPATPPPPPERPANHRVTPITLALAVITAGACVLLHEISPWFGVAHTVGLVLAVLGTGLVIGSLVRGGRGLLLFAVPLGILALLFTMSHIGRDARHLGGVLGDQSYAPVSAQAVRPSYDSGAGDLTVDLRGLPAGGEPVHTAIRVGLGDARVLVPPNADVDAHCSTGIGDVDCLGLRSTGHSNGIDAHDPGLPGGSTITLDVTAGSGNVEVTRG